MTADERTRAIAYLEQTKAEVLAAASGLSRDEWVFKPSPDQWSAADCVEHLALFEDSLFGKIQEAVAGPAAPDQILAGLAGKEEKIIRMVRSRSVKVQAPERVRPANRCTEPDALVERFTEVRDRTISYVHTTGDPLRTRTHAHFALGALDCYQWLFFLAAHSERHLKQMKETVARHTSLGIA